MSQIETLPYWMQILSFVLSAILSIFSIIIAIYGIAKRSSLNLLVTKEAFLRLFHEGECIYTNVIVVSHNIGSLIQEVSASLSRKSGSKKEYTLHLFKKGEKYRKDNGEVAYFLNTDSPLQFIPKDVPQNLVYVFKISEHSLTIQRVFRAFNAIVVQMKDSFLSEHPDPNRDELQPLFTDIDRVIDRHVNQVMDLVQIEEGEYELRVLVKYLCRYSFLPIQHSKEISSIVSFSVDSTVKLLFRSQLVKVFQTASVNEITDKQLPISWPDCSFIDVKEKGA